MNIDLTLSEQIEVIKDYLSKPKNIYIKNNLPIWKIFVVYQVPLGKRELMFKLLIKLQKRQKEQKENWTRKKTYKNNMLTLYKDPKNDYGGLTIGDVIIKDQNIFIKNIVD